MARNCGHLSLRNVLRLTHRVTVMAVAEAAGVRKRNLVDYKQLHSLSSVVLYDNAPKMKTRGKFFEVDRILAKRKIRFDHEYLIKWKDWPLDACSWEVSSNLTSDLIRNYEKPTNISNARLEYACRQFACGVLSALKSPSFAAVYIDMELDIWRYVTYKKGKASKHQGHTLFAKEDFSRLKYLSPHWWYCMSDNGVGMAVDFPLKIKPLLSWSPAHSYVKEGTVCKAQRYPLEKICVTLVKKPCNVDNLYM